MKVPIKLIKAALNTLEIIEDRKAKYGEITRQLKELQGDFYMDIQAIDSDTETGVVKLLDAILEPYGIELAGYYLYECGFGGGAIYEKNEDAPPTKYEIKSVDDLRKYVFRK